jgi:hypothetical protein
METNKNVILSSATASRATFGTIASQQHNTFFYFFYFYFGLFPLCMSMREKSVTRGEATERRRLPAVA